MLPQLTATEARVIGCLMEKSITTPNQYPLTLNALTNACNQKSAREPVMALQPAQVQRTARTLRDNSLVQLEENFKTGAEKYKQRLCNTPYNDLQFDSAQFALICLLLLRGPQTPGELRARSGRLHAFSDNEAVITALESMTGQAQDELIVQLPRTSGRKHSEYMHQLCGPVDVEAYADAQAAAGAGHSGRVAELVHKVETLEAEVVRLKAELAARD